MDWTVHHEVEFADVETPLVRLTVSNAGWLSKSKRYVGRIADANWRVVRQSEEFASIGEAQRWCEQAYEALLFAELAIIRALPETSP